MIGICSQCGNYEWDKRVEGDTVTCPRCGNSWKFLKKPIFFLTGCSGVGKTTTGQALQKLTKDFVVLDADMFHSIMKPQTTEDYASMIEQIFGLSKNINQAGKPVVWTMAGNIDRLPHAYGARFFSEIKVLALTVSDTVLQKRMREGRGIQDPAWLQSSVDYNAYFRTHDRIGDTAFETLDCSQITPEEAAVQVLAWLRNS